MSFPLQTLILLGLAITFALIVAVSGGEAPESAAPGASVVERAGAEASFDPPGPRPNVVLIVADDQDLASVAMMPKLQRALASRGSSYENAFASLPQCCPSRATLLSGQYAHNHGVLDNDPPHGGNAAFDPARALPVWLRKSGYRTAWVGKYLNGYGNPGRGGDPLEVPVGWDRWVAPVNHTEYRMFGYTLNRDGQLRDYGTEPGDYQTDVLAGEAASFLRDGTRGRRPFFLAVSTLAPHKEGPPLDTYPNAPRNPRPAPRHLGSFDSAPLPRPPSFNEADVSDKTTVVTERAPLTKTEVSRLRTLQRSRLESLMAVDDLVGRVVRTLRRSGELNRTLIIYTSDQGFLLGEHRLTGKNRLYEEAIRVPLLMRGPGIPAGASRDELVGNVDIAPTIAAVTGADPDLEVDGRSLLSGSGEPRPLPPRPLLLELFQGGRFAGVRDDSWAYLDFRNRGVELYDIGADPFQLDNLAGDPALAGVRERYAATLRRLRSCAGSTCR